MAQPVMQKSYNSGEWAPQLYARVDIEKYHSGAALLKNFFVDYRGGASTRAGTEYVLQSPGIGARLIPFQITNDIGYSLEFGDQYIRFYSGGSPVLESSHAITGISKANPGVVTCGVSGYNNGDWVRISGVNGMTQVNGNYYIITNISGTGFDLYDLFGNPVNTTGYSTYTGSGVVRRVYQIASPYAVADVGKLKFAPYVNTLILCHPNYAPAVLTYTNATDWDISNIPFGSTTTTPAAPTVATTLGAGTWHYAYLVTAVDINGQESLPSTPGTLANKLFLGTTNQGTNTVTWAAVPGAVSYNVYAAVPVDSAAVPAGAQFGFIGNCTGTTFCDSNIGPDFALGPPIARNPFQPGSNVQSVVITNPGSYLAAPTATFDAPGGGGITATGTPVLGAVSLIISNPGLQTVSVGQKLFFANGLICKVTSVNGGNLVTGMSILYPGSVTVVPSQPQSPSGNATMQITFHYGVLSIALTNPGSGYSTVPNITFSAGAAAATAVLSDPTSGFPSVPAFFQQRLVLGGQTTAPQTLFMSQTGNFYNFNISNPVQDTDAITATLVSGLVSNIKAMIAQPSGLLVLTDGASWLINGGSFGSAVTPSAIIASPQSFNGCNDMPPIVSNFDVIYAQSKGFSVRDSTYNFYANVFTGTDISILSSHLFFNKPLKEWCWAEEPYRVVWAVRQDGTALSLTFMKEQDFCAWCHSTTGDATNDLFKSTASIIENQTQGYVNAVYFIVQRTINGVVVEYIERLNSRYIPSDYTNSWCVDAGAHFSGSPATSFTGAQHLGGRTVTGLADGAVITPFVMPATGAFTLPSAASKVTIGLPFTAQLQTLPIDTGEPTIQGKQKKINAVTVRAADTLGIKIGSDFNHLTPMKDFILGNVGSQTNEIVTDLVDGDGRTYVDPLWSEQGQFAIQQDLPYPATILGVIPQLAVGDTKDTRS